MYLEIKKDVFEKNQKEAQEEGIASIGEEGKNSLVFDVVETIDEFNIEDNQIELCVQTRVKGEELVYFSLTIPLDMDDIASLISSYVKKANKIKTLLEASK